MTLQGPPSPQHSHCSSSFWVHLCLIQAGCARQKAQRDSAKRNPNRMLMMYSTNTPTSSREIPSRSSGNIQDFAADNLGLRSGGTCSYCSKPHQHVKDGTSSHKATQTTNTHHSIYTMDKCTVLYHLNL